MTRTVLADQPGMSNTLTVNLPLRRIVTIRRLAITQLVLGGILALLEIICMGTGLVRYDIMCMIGAGIWCGCVFAVSGLLGILATRSPTTGVGRRGFFTGVLVMCIFCSILAGAMFSFAIATTITATFFPLLPRDDFHHWSRADILSALMGFRITSIFIYFALFILYIIAAVYASLNVCGSGPRTVPADQVVYHTITTYAAPSQVPEHGQAVAGSLVYTHDMPPLYDAATKDSDITIQEKQGLLQT